MSMLEEKLLRRIFIANQGARRVQRRVVIKRPVKGAVAQLGERLPCTQEVVGSIPSGSTIFKHK